MADVQDDLIIPEEIIKDKIYILRGQKVMLDKDLAELYGVKPIRLREQVKRNIDRFPSRFMFQLTEKEVELMDYRQSLKDKTTEAQPRPRGGAASAERGFFVD